MNTLCETCRYCRQIVSGKGSRFLLCERSLAPKNETGREFPKYPPQPVWQCSGFVGNDVTELECDSEDEARES